VLAASMLGGAPAQAQQPESLVYPKTEYSQRTEALAKEFNAEASKPAPILIMDRDLFAVNLALRHIDPFDPPARAQLIAELAKAQTGLSIDPQRFQMATYQMTDDDPTTWSPGYGPSADLPGPGFCTVFSQDPDTDGPTQQRSLSNLNGIFDPIGRLPLINPLSRALINAYTDYHELGHCFYYDPPPAKGADPDVVNFQRHKHEMFGDVFASLLLARDGVTDFAGRYARVRLIASATAGIDDEYLHATWDGLMAAQREINARGVDGMKRLSVADIRDIALRITQENAIDIGKMRFAAEFQRSGYNETFLQTSVNNNPAMAGAAEYARRLKDEMNDALATSVDLRAASPKNLTPLQLLEHYRAHPVETPDAPDALSYKELTEQVRDELLAISRKNGGSLAQALDTRKDDLRHTLETGDDAARYDAHRRLACMENAFRQALKTAEGKKSAPKPAI
jgi:hypothetical protein